MSGEEGPRAYLNPQQPVQYQYATQQPVQYVTNQGYQQGAAQQGDGASVNLPASSTVQGEPGEFDCGTSEFGLRMDFKSRKYRDMAFLVLWLGTMALWMILLIAFAAQKTPETTTETYSWNGSVSSSTSADSDVASILGKIIGTFLTICAVGILCGFLWLEMMFKFAKVILKIIIALKLFFWALVAVVFIIFGMALGSAGSGFIYLGVMCLVVFAVLALYYWCVRARLQLAAAMIRLGSKVVQMNKATILLQFLTSIALFVWWILWLVVVILWVTKLPYNGFVMFLMLFVHYWTMDVLANIAHVTTCGVTAVWWFNKDRMANPTWNSYRYAITKGLGSICYGSMLVAIVQTLRSMAKNAARRGGLGACICYLCFVFFEWLIRYFSMYAFVQVAIYGVNFLQAAKNTWQLLSSKGLDALINDNLSDSVLAAGAFVGGLITCILGGLLGYVFFLSYSDSTGILAGILFAIVGFYIGYFFTLEFMFAVHSAIKAVFVCWAEDPAALNQTHPKCYLLLARAWSKVHGGVIFQFDDTQELD